MTTAATTKNAVNSRLETTGGITPTVPGGYLDFDKDGTALVPADLNEESFRRYLAQVYGVTFAGKCTKYIFHDSGNTTVALGLADIVTFLGTPSNVPQRVGAGVENPQDVKQGVVWTVLNAIKHARGLKIDEERTGGNGYS